MPALFILAAFTILALSILSVVKGLRDGKVFYKTHLSFSREEQPTLFRVVLWSHGVAGASAAAALLFLGLWQLTH